MFKLEESWQNILKEELEKPYIKELQLFVEEERKKKAAIYPQEELVFNAFSKTPYASVKVVIMGQDPYHQPGQAHGLSFSVPEGVKLPPSLRNIYKELKADLEIEKSPNGCLENWAKQGVLLLNATLTVNEGSPMSHHGKGWELFTDAAIEALVKREDPVIFVLWGNSAQRKAEKIAKNKDHPILTAPHPSPFSAYTGFFGCRHFSQINNLLQQMDKKQIDWGL
ncbi:MAG TPA: uracil-DNA glycosylase [Parachlamydiaceae bacterium]|nr:uracil-DNA glycosylase [Parachlamydiaceae bacterium]